MPASTNLHPNQKGLSLTLLLLLVVVILALAGSWYFFYSKKDNPDRVFQRPQDQKTSGSKSADTATLSNPASEYCIKVGGELQGETFGDGGQYSLCNFENNMACEEWALYRRQCPIGGIKTIGFDTKEEAYCALIGGKTTAEPNADCTLPGGKVCSNTDLYNGKCQ